MDNILRRLKKSFFFSVQTSSLQEISYEWLTITCEKNKGEISDMGRVFKIGCAGLIAVAVVVFIFVVIIRDDTPTTTNTNITPKIGDTVINGGLEFKILSISTLPSFKSLALGTMVKPSLGQNFLVLDLQIKNISEQTVYPLSSYMMVLKDKSGKSYLSLEDISLDNGASIFFNQQIHPNSIKKGRIAFDVPSAASDTFTLEVKDYPYNNSKPTKILLKK